MPPFVQTRLLSNSVTITGDTLRTGLVPKSGVEVDDMKAEAGMGDSPSACLTSSSRRDFMKGLGAGLVGLSGLLGSEAKAFIYDNMEYLAKHLPPGILHCRDRAIRILWAQEIAVLWNDFPQINDRMEGRYDGFFDPVIVSRSSIHIEPAWYLLRERINARNPRYNVSDLSSKVPQMKAFDDGIKQWFNAVWREHKHRIPDAEKRLVHAIAYAAFAERVPVTCIKQVGDYCMEKSDPLDLRTAEAGAKRYLESGPDEREAVLARMAERFREMGNGNRESTDPYDPYNRQLVAAYAAEALANLQSLEIYQNTLDRSLYPDPKRLWKNVIDYINVPLIDVIGYNLFPFKGQHDILYPGVMDKAGYTERRYFEAKSR